MQFAWSEACQDHLLMHFVKLFLTNMLVQIDAWKTGKENMAAAAPPKDPNFFETSQIKGCPYPRLRNPVSATD